MYFSTRLLHQNPIIPTTKQQSLVPRTPIQLNTAPNCSSSPNHIFRRRDFASSLLLSFLISPDLGRPLRAETTDTNCVDPEPAKQAFIDVSIDGQPIGRIVIGLYSDFAPVGSARFAELVTGKAGVSYRRKEFVKIMPNYVQHGGLRSYGVDAELAQKIGRRNLTVDNLVDEWEKQQENCSGTKNLAKSVGIVVRDPTKPPPKLKLVARKGKLEIDQEQVGKDPNGTEFVIATKDSPELDASTLVVGRVLQGMEVVERIGQVKTVQENTSSPYFRVAKLIGDKRAVVAERGFNRPYSKVVITNCGLLE